MKYEMTVLLDSSLSAATTKEEASQEAIGGKNDEAAASMDEKSNKQEPKKATQNKPVVAPRPTALLSDNAAAPSAEEEEAKPKESNSQKLQFVWHLGPSKTATTTLQHDARDMTTQLQEDNYVYLGKYHRARKSTNNKQQESSVLDSTLLDRSCMRQLQSNYNAHNSENTTGAAQVAGEQQTHGHTTTAAASVPYNHIPCWRAFVEEVEAYRNQGTSIILSSEHYTNDESPLYESFDAVTDAMHQLLDDDFNVTVVVGYRRYMEWTLSALKQQHSMPLVPRRTWERYNKKANTWSTLRKWLHRTPTPSAKNYNYIDTIVPLWRDRGRWSNTRVLNFHSDNKEHDDEHISTRFFCNLVPNAKHTCQYTKERPAPRQSNARSSALSSYHNIVLEAAKRGLIDKQKHNRYEMVHNLAGFYEQTLGLNHKDLPLQCPPQEELQELLHVSLQLEQTWMPEFYVRHYQDHRDAFDKLVHNKKAFCTVDTDRLLDGASSWEQVLDRLRANDWNSSSNIKAAATTAAQQNIRSSRRLP